MNLKSPARGAIGEREEIRKALCGWIAGGDHSAFAHD